MLHSENLDSYFVVMFLTGTQNEDDSRIFFDRVGSMTTSCNSMILVEAMYVHELVKKMYGGDIAIIVKV